MQRYKKNIICGYIFIFFINLPVYLVEVTIKITHIEQTDSTNAYLQRLQATTDIRGCAVAADRQVAGRGMGDNVWESGAGQNLTFSVALDMSFLPAEAQFQLSKAVSLGVLDALNEAAPEKFFSIKWPNDIYCEGHKTGGILISNGINGKMMDVSIVGIGLNVNQTIFRDWPTNPSSLFNLTGRKFDLETLLQSVCLHLEKQWARLKKCIDIQDFSSLDEEYLKNLLRYRAWGDYEVGGMVKSLYMEGVDAFGRLQLRDAFGETHIFDVKEIKFRW